MSEWQPIETAPRGEGVLVTDGGNIVGVASYIHERWRFWEGKADATFFRDETDQYAAELNEWIDGFGPTHWMPLPEPPQEDAG